MIQEPSSYSPRRQLRVILIITFIAVLGLSMPYFIFSTLFFHPNYSIIPGEWSENSRNLFTGAFFSAYPLSQLLIFPLLRSLFEGKGKQKLMVSTILIVGLCNLGTAFALETKAIWLLVLSPISGGLTEGLMAVAQAMAADIEKIDKNETFGKISAAWSIGYLIGPFLGGLFSDSTLWEYFSFSLLFLIVFLLFTCLALFCFFYLVEIRVPPQSSKRTLFEYINFFSRLKIFFKNSALKQSLCIVTLYTFAVDMFYEFGPVYLTDTWELGPSALAIYNAFQCIALAAGSGWLIEKLTNYYSNGVIVCGSIAIFTATLIGISVIHNPMIVLILYSAIGLTIAVATTNLTVQVSNSVSGEDQCEVMTVLASLRVVAYSVICLFGSMLLLFSAQFLLILAAAVGLVTLSCWVLLNFNFTIPIVIQNTNLDQSESSHG